MPAARLAHGGPVGPRAAAIRSPFRTDSPTSSWSHPDATERSPLLIVHDGPEYAEHSRSSPNCSGQPAAPPRGVLAPVERNGILRARATPRARPAERLPGSTRPRPGACGAGQPRCSRALPRHRPPSRRFDAPLPPVGSFFRRGDSYERWFRATGGSPASSAASIATPGPERTIPVVLPAAPWRRTCPPTAPLEEALAAAATTATAQSATATTGSPGATRSTRTCGSSSSGGGRERRYVSSAPAIGAAGA